MPVAVLLELVFRMNTPGSLWSVIPMRVARGD